MTLISAIEKYLISNKGFATLNQIVDTFRGEYSLRTIEETLNSNADTFAVKGANVYLNGYDIQSIHTIIGGYSRNYPGRSSDLFELISYFIYAYKQLGNPQPFERILLDTAEANKLFDPTALSAILQRVNKLFAKEISLVLCNSLNTIKSPEELYSFSQSIYAYFVSLNQMAGLSTTPSTLIKLISGLIPQKNNLSIYNPAGGMLNLLTGIVIKNRNIISACASEINEDVCQYGRRFAATNGINVAYTCTDSITELANSTATYDIIVSIPPFKVRHTTPVHIIQDTAYEIITKSLNNLSVNGTAIFAVADTALTSQTKIDTQFREHIINSGYLKTVISLPLNLFAPFTGIKTSLLVFRNNYKHSNAVSFIDASELYKLNRDKSISININEIHGLISSETLLISEPQVHYSKSNCHELLIDDLRNDKYRLYIKPQEQAIMLNPGEKLYPLKDVTHRANLSTSNEFAVPYLRIRDLNAGIISSLDALDINATKNRGKLLSNKAILIGTIGSSYKPSLFDVPNAKVEVASNIIALKVDEKLVAPAYLVKELNKPYVLEQFEANSFGSTTLKHLRVDDILNVKVALPTLDKQFSILETLSNYSVEAAPKPKGDLNEDQIINIINHEIGNLLEGPMGLLNFLPKFLAENSVSMDTPSHKGNQNARSIRQRLESAIDDLKRIKDIKNELKDVLDTDESNCFPSEVNLIDFLHSKLSYLNEKRDFDFFIGINKNFSKVKAINTDIDGKQFTILLNNIISNACNHANLEDGQRLVVVANITPMEDTLQIEMMNNGQPFPSNFGLSEYIKVERKSGTSKGKGIGGYLVNKVVKNHNGTLELLPPNTFIVNAPAGDFEFHANVNIKINLPYNTKNGK